ncbi:Putative restriction endonuclease domain-containing protein OS=Streptomyces fumanus OX=67302 GN=GCM10018772_42490 PE=4 SV=1 [Streptomyces fumanus]
MLVAYDLEGGRYVERTTALAGTTTRLDVPLPVSIDPAGLTRQ